MTRIVADDAIFAVTETFSAYGEVVTLPSAEIDRSAIEGADALLVRSVTRIDDALVEGTRLRFVGTATAGTDHVDVSALERRGIAFASAPGCNASAVVHYVLVVLFAVASEAGSDWLGEGPVGIVGFGHIGSRVAKTLSALGLTVLVDDPPLEARLRRGDRLPPHVPPLASVSPEPFVPLAEVIERSRVLSLHVPLTTTGPHPTFHAIAGDALGRLGPGSLLVQTSRGGVVDDRALEAWLEAGRGTAVLDVWEGEPDLRTSLLAPHLPLRFATPHVAGYSLEGKARATASLLDAARPILGAPGSAPAPNVPMAPAGVLDLRDHPARGLDLVAEALRRTYPIEEDDAAVRRLATLPRPEKIAAFEALRRRYPLRREPSAYAVLLPDDPGTEGLRRPADEVLRAIGFDVR